MLLFDYCLQLLGFPFHNSFVGRRAQIFLCRLLLLKLHPAHLLAKGVVEVKVDLLQLCELFADQLTSFEIVRVRIKAYMCCLAILELL